MQMASGYFVDQLKQNTKAVEYLEKRGLTRETISEWKIGYAPDSFQATSDYLKEKGVTEQQLIDTGLIKKREKGSGTYDVFRGRVMFPILDNLGRMVAFTGRIFVQNENAPKYLNTPDTDLFNKSEVLFGLDRAKQSVRKLDYIILAEGQMDVVMSHQAGVKNTVASSGTAFTQEHLAAISSLTKRILFAFDSDEAGVNAMKRSGLLALKSGFDVKVLVLEGAKDPADIVKENPDEWRKSIKQSTAIIDYLINDLIDRKIEERLRIRRISTDIIPFLASLQSSIETAHYVKKISEVFSIQENAVWEELEKNKNNEQKKEVYIDDEKVDVLSQATGKESGSQKREKMLAALLYIGENNKDYFSREDIIEKMQSIAGDDEVEVLLTKYSDEKEKITFEVENLLFSNEERLEEKITTHINDLLRSYEIEYIDIKLKQLKQDLKFAEQKNDSEESKKLLETFNSLLEKKHNLQTSL